MPIVLQELQQRPIEKHVAEARGRLLTICKEEVINNANTIILILTFFLLNINPPINSVI
jgi:hypothetical protein